MVLVDFKNWYIVTLFNALELKSDLRWYKYEKRIVRAEDDDAKYLDSGSILGFITFRFHKLKSKKDNETDDFPVYDKLIRDGTMENFIVKSAFGFLGGLLLTYLCYLFLVYSLNFTLRRATLICIGLGVILSLGLAFSVRIRCTVLLCIPQLFSKRGRQALLAYAFILALSGPAKNTLHNVEVMSESLACGQEELKKAENELLKCVRRPNLAVKQPLESMLVKLDTAVKGYKNFIESFYKDCEAVIESIIRAQEWLYSIYLLCNEKMGSPYSRCTELLFEASQNCKSVSTDEEWTKACEILSMNEYICAARDGPICTAEDLPPFWPLLNNRKKLYDFKREAMNALFVKVETHQILTQPNRTATLHEEYQGMATEIRQKTDQFLQYFDVMSVIFGIFILVLFIKVIIYRYKFLTEDDYDNRFITSDFIDIDKTRAEFRMQTLLPLEPREMKKYIKVTSMRLVPYERQRLLSSFIFLIFATFKIIIHMLTDCSLYWMLSTMRKHGRMLLANADLNVPQITVFVDGTGFYAEFLRNVTRTVRPYTVQQILDPVPCLPDPISPDWNRYWQILTLVLICWLLAFCEPYGLRLRHIVMVTYHPDRARERAIWLYNRILTTRINFVKFARRQLRRKYKDSDEDRFFRPHFFLIRRRLKCLLCKEDLNDIECIKCPVVGCVGIYCGPCFDTLQLCSICKDPSYYGDYSDVSEEKDSEEETVPCSRCSYASTDRTYLRRASFADFYTFQMNCNTGPCSAYQKFQISMDTIVDVDETENGQDKTVAPAVSPSILTRLMHQCKKVFSSKSRASDETMSGEKGRRCWGDTSKPRPDVYFFTTAEDSVPGSGISKISSKEWDTFRKSRSSKNTKSSKRSRKTLKKFGLFRWKLKDKISGETDTFPDGSRCEIRSQMNRMNLFADGRRCVRRRERSWNWTEVRPLSRIHSETNLEDEEGPSEAPKDINSVIEIKSGGYMNKDKRDTSSSLDGQRTSDSNRSKDKFSLIEKWRHPNFRTDKSGGMESHKQGSDESYHSGVEKFSEGDRGSLTDKETQTCDTASDVQLVSAMDCNSAMNIEEREPSRMTSQDNINSSSVSSSTYGAIRKELIDARRRRQKSREKIKTSSYVARRTKRCNTKYETTSDSSGDGKPVKSRRTRNRNLRLGITDADIILTNSAQKVLTKKVDMMKAKLARFFKRSIRKQSSSDDAGLTTEIDSDDYVQKFMSEDEQRTDGNRFGTKTVRCAPDLLSDLPSSMTPDGNFDARIESDG